MSFEVLLEVFLAGITVGFGPCFLFCAPVIFPYILANGTTAKEGFRTTVIFSLGRIIAYGILGFVAVYLIDTLNIQNVYFKKIAGFFIVLIGITYIFSKAEHKICGLSNKFLIEKLRFNMLILGLLVGMSPCVPLIGILTYILVKSTTVFTGLLYGVSFGLGTFFSPLLVVGFIAGGLSKIISRQQKMFLLMKILSGIILAYFGLKLII
ncbi:MAG: sulfite exporter TauE/SafE family protein [Elusimicrobiota bacterium]